MFACCALCYEKYIREDGGIDAGKYRKALKEKGLEEPADPCMCKCHVEGSQILH